MLSALLALAAILPGQAGAEGPREVSAAVYVFDLRSLDDAAQTVEVDFVIWLTWKDPVLAHSGTSFVSRALEDIWHPDIQIAQGANLRLLRKRVADVFPDGTVRYRQRYAGPLGQTFRYSDFPLDRQVVQIHVLSPLAGQLAFVEDPRTGVASELSVPNLVVGAWTFGTGVTEIQEMRLPSFTLEFPVERHLATFVWNILLPLTLVVFMSWTVFWISPSLAASQIAVATTSILTLIAYRFFLRQSVPSLPYLTRLDQFTLGASVLVFLALVEVITTTSLAERGKLPLAQRLDRGARWFFPLLFMGIVAKALFL